MTRHPVDLRSLVPGLLFVTLAVLFVFDQLGSLDLDVRWIPAVVLLVLGLAGIATGLRRASVPPRAAAPLEPDA